MRTNRKDAFFAVAEQLRTFFVGCFDVFFFATSNFFGGEVWGIGGCATAKVRSWGRKLVVIGF
jgi:hypothetical protein